MTNHFVQHLNVWDPQPDTLTPAGPDPPLPHGETLSLTYQPALDSPYPMSEDVIRPGDGRTTENQEIGRRRRPALVSIHVVTNPYPPLAGSCDANTGMQQSFSTPSASPSSCCDPVCIAMEPTDCYHIHCAQAAYSSGHRVYLIDPSRLAHYRERIGQSVKAVQQDAQLLALVYP